MTLQRPPLGLMPKYIWLTFLEGEQPSKTEIENRIKAIDAAILRYKNAAYPVPAEWLDEKQSYNR